MTGQATDLLRWPLWSWRNLSVTAAAVLLAFYGMGRVIEPAKTTPTREQVPVVAESPASLTSSGSPMTASIPVPAPAVTATFTSPVHSTGKSESVTRLATAFAQAWSSSTRSQPEWMRGIQPLVTPALAAGLAHTDPALVPATKVTGEAALLTASSTLAHVTVPTNGGSIVVTLHRSSSGPWLVSDVEPADQPPGVPTPDLQPRQRADRS